MKGSRTIIIAVAAALLPIAELLMPILELPQFQAVIDDWLPEQYRSIYSLFVAGLMLYMRTITTGPMSPPWEDDNDLERN